MKIGETGEVRVRGYLLLLRQSLRSFLAREALSDALRELESHIRERIDAAEPGPDEEATLARILDELGTPLQVARGYSAEMTLEEAVATGRFTPTARALWQLATTTLLGFFPFLGLLVGYVLGASFLLVALLKPVFPNNTGVVLVDGSPRGFGIMGDLPPGAQMWGGYWLIPILIALGVSILVLTQRGATRFLVWWRARGLRGE